METTEADAAAEETLVAVAAEAAVMVAVEAADDVSTAEAADAVAVEVADSRSLLRKAKSTTSPSKPLEPRETESAK